MIDVEQWAEIRRLHFAEKMPIKAIVRQLGLSRNTVRNAARADAPPKYERAPAGSAVDALEVAPTPDPPTRPAGDFRPATNGDFHLAIDNSPTAVAKSPVDSPRRYNNGLRSSSSDTRSPRSFGQHEQAKPERCPCGNQSGCAERCLDGFSGTMSWRISANLLEQWTIGNDFLQWFWSGRITATGLQLTPSR